ncbi:MAG: STAS domain-containing protein [Cytophagales bacterium]|nr:STAS domain-containing protein [Armatimonadota bacterium]
MDITVVESSAPGVPLVQLRGEIDLHTCPELRAALQRLMEEGKFRIVLNMSEVPYLDSAALGVLVDAVRRARENNGGLYLAQVMTFVRRAFEITRLIRIFPVYDTIDEAVAAALASGTAGKAVSGSEANPAAA